MASIFTNSGAEILVDDSDYEELSKISWWISGEGYAYCSTWIDGRSVNVAMHRILMGLKRGDRRKVDHDNGNTLDNRRKNLRVCTNAQNQGNRGKNKNNTSGFKGVTWSKTRKKWYAHIGFGGRDHFLGFYATPEDAHQAYCQAVPTWINSHVFYRGDWVIQTVSDAVVAAVQVAAEIREQEIAEQRAKAA